MEGGNSEERWWIKLKMRSLEKEVMRRRKDLEKKEIRVDNDATWKERKMRWNLEEIAKTERSERKIV